MEFPSPAQVLLSSSSSSTASGAGLDHFPTPAGGGGHDAIAVRELGLCPYEPAWQDMQRFTGARDAATPDELWVLEHAPVYTLGLAARAAHLPRAANATPRIPVVKTDRGGQITYHGPGQAVVYTLVDIARRGIRVRDMVCLLEQAAIDLLAAHGIAAARKPGAPGVYVLHHGAPGAKIAALGLKVKRQGCYHGISLNVDMDLAPFADIDPCGYPGLAVTSLRELGVAITAPEAGRELAGRIAGLLDRKACA
jgi:lipoyl(octanoyl) transferase